LGHTDPVLSVTFNPDGKQVISGSGDNTVKLWDVESGLELKSLSGHKGSVNSVSFSPDGKLILSGSTDRTIRLWDATSGQELKTLSGHRGSVNSVSFSPDGKLIVSGSDDKTIRLWDAAGGRRIKTFQGRRSVVNSVSFSPDGRLIVSGSDDGTIRLWDAAWGTELGASSGHIKPVLSVSFSPDGKQILSSSRDGTIRLRSMSTGNEIAQFISFTDGEWICLTSKGYYNASVKGDQYVRVGYNNYGMDQYRNSFDKPEIVQALLQELPAPVDELVTVQVVQDENMPVPIPVPVIQRFHEPPEIIEPPVVVIHTPENGVTLASGQVELSVSVVDRRQRIETIEVLVNGRLVGGETMRSSITGIRGGDLEATGIRFTQNQNRVDFRLSLNLDLGLNLIQVFATNPYSVGRDQVEVIYVQTQRLNLPNLWILSIGINRYDSRQLDDLNYAVNDARAIIDVFKTQEGKLYRSVNSRLIADGAAIMPTRANITDNFAYLKQADQQDVVILFIAGHGRSDAWRNFYLMPSDTEIHDDGSFRLSSAISYQEIKSVLAMPGQKLMFIDACHSGGVNNTQLARDLENNSTVIFTASKESEKSYESQEFRHGYFTHAIIQGIRGAADPYKTGTVTMKGLDLYVSDTVNRLTGGKQNPTTLTPNGYVNFIVADLE
jgi:sugar lactone lactonase YvrE